MSHLVKRPCQKSLSYHRKVSYRATLNLTYPSLPDWLSTEEARTSITPNTLLPSRYSNCSAFSRIHRSLLSAKNSANSTNEAAFTSSDCNLQYGISEQTFMIVLKQAWLTARDFSSKLWWKSHFRITEFSEFFLNSFSIAPHARLYTCWFLDVSMYCKPV